MSGGTPYDFFYINSLSGGLNVADSPLALADDEMQVADNVTVEETGAINRRHGYVLDGAVTAGCSNIFNSHRFYRTGATAMTILSTDNTAAPAGQIFNYTSGSYVTGGTTLANLKARFKVYKDKLFIFNGYQTQVTSDGVTKNDIAYDTTSGYSDRGTDIRCMEICDDRIFIVTESEPNTLYFSDYGGWNTGPDSDLLFQTSNYLNIPKRTDDGTGITAIKAYGNNDELIVFRENDTFVLIGVGATDYSLRMLRNEAGCVSNDGVVELDDGRMVVVGNGKIFMLYDDQMIPISHQIETLLVNAQLSTAVADYDPRNDVVVISTTDRSYVLNVTQTEYNVDPLLAWSQWTTLAPNSMARYKGVGDGNYVYFTFANDTNIYRFGGNDDNGTDITMTFQTKTFDLEQFGEKKQFRSLRTLQDTTQLQPFDATLIVDNTAIETRTMVLPSAGTTWNSFNWGAANWTGANRLNGSLIIGKNAAGFEFSIKITSTDSAPLTIHRIALEILRRNRDRLWDKD